MTEGHHARVLAAALFGLAHSLPAQSPLEADRAAIIAAIDAGARALQTKDWAAYSRFWANATDIEIIHPSAREWLVGWDTVARKYRAVITDTTVQYSFTPVRRNVHVSPSRDMAWVTEELRMTVRAARVQELTQWSTYVFERRGGEWRLVHGHASIPPVPRPSP